MLTADRLRNMSLEDLETYRRNQILDLWGKGVIHQCLYIASRIGQPRNENGYRIVTVSKGNINIRITDLTAQYDEQTRKILPRRRLVVTHTINGKYIRPTQVINVVLLGEEGQEKLIDEAEWSRAIPGTWMEIINLVEKTLRIRQDQTQEEKLEERRQKLLAILITGENQ